MGKKRSSSDLLPTFFRRFFGEEVGGLVELRVFPNGRGKMEARDWVADPVAFMDFVNAYDAKDGNLAIYFAPAVRGRKGGTKADVAFSRALWAEVDCDKLGWDSVETARVIHSLPGCLQPSLCIHSGHGLHLYWYLNEDHQIDHGGKFAATAKAMSTFEGVNRLLRDMVSGDNVWNADRVMRVPGTWNTKSRPVQSRVVWHYHWHEHSMRDIHDAVSEFDHVLDFDGFVSRETWQARDDKRRAENADPARAYAIGNEDKRKRASARGLAAWNNCRYGGGPGYLGIDEAIMQFTAWEYCRLSAPTPEKVERIVQDTLAKVRDIYNRDASHETWDWREEEREVRQKLGRWIKKWEAIKSSAK